jgi:serine/threonine-protein kinase
LQTTSSISRAPANSAEATDDLQDRIARFARFALTLSATIFVVARVVDFSKAGGLSINDFVAPNRIAYEFALLVLFLAWRRCRGGTPMTKVALERLDAALTIVISTCWGMLGWGPGANYPVSLAMPLTHTLIGRSVIVPSTFRRTLWISVGSAVPTVFIIATHGTFVPGAVFDRARVVLAVSWCGVAVAVAVLSSRTLYGLRKQIIDAGKLGQYTLQEKIGEGGMGVVYRATHAMLRRPAAIKLLLREHAGESDVARFEREVQLTSRLAHPNTISIFDYGRTSEGAFYYVMEYLDGMDLERLVEMDGPVAPPRAIHILAQVSGALAEAHALGLIHRDIKPANIVLTERADEPDVVKVVDFGLVRTLERNQGDSGVNTAIVGTPLYMAPRRSPRRKLWTGARISTLWAPSHTFCSQGSTCSRRRPQLRCAAGTCWRPRSPRRNAWASPCPPTSRRSFWRVSQKSPAADLPRLRPSERRFLDAGTPSAMT